MVQMRISEAQRWQIIGMQIIGMSFKAIGRQMGCHYTVVSRLVRKHTEANNVKDLLRMNNFFLKHRTSIPKLEA
jgi:IS30 family transposase